MTSTCKPRFGCLFAPGTDWGGHPQSGHGPHPFWQWTFAPPLKKIFFISLNFPNLCDNFVRKLVSEIRKCHQLQGDFFPLTLWPFYMLLQTWSTLVTHSTCSLYFSKSCDYFVQKLVSEIRKCRQLQGDHPSDPLTITCWHRLSHTLVMTV